MANSGIVYKLVCMDVDVVECYVGSTTNFRVRKCYHKDACNKDSNKGYNYYVYQFIRDHGGFDNWDMVLLEEVQFDNRQQLRARERHWLETLHATLNSQKPNRTRKEWHNDNRESILVGMKINRDKNKDVRKLKNVKYTCECGLTLCKESKSRHIKSVRHQKYLALFNLG